MMFVEWFMPFIRTYTPHQRAWMARLFWTALALWIVSLATIGGMGILDDEGSYIPSAQAIGAFLRGEIDWATMLEPVVRYGWFMPGVPLLFTPLFLFGDPGTFVVRFYSGFLILVLWLWMQREVNRVLGPVCVIALLAFPTLMLNWQFFAKTALGDVPAGLVMTVVFCRLFTITRAILAGREVRFRDIAVLELVLVLMVYLRGSTWILVAAIHFYLGAIALFAGNRAMLSAVFTRIATGFLVFAALLAPWSVVASSYFGAPVLTTTTATLAFGVTFGDVRKLCFGPCPEGNLWFEAGKFSRQISTARGISELEVQREMARSALGAFNIPRYLKRVRANFRNFLLKPNWYNQFFIDRVTKMGGKATVLLSDALHLLSSIGLYTIYLPALCALFIGNLCIATRRESEQIISLMIKMFTLCILIQPFVHISHSRYWPTFAPLMSLSAAAIFMWVWTRLGRSRPGRPATTLTVTGIHDEVSAPGLKSLVIVQALYVALILVIAAVILSA